MMEQEGESREEEENKQPLPQPQPPALYDEMVQSLEQLLGPSPSTTGDRASCGVSANKRLTGGESRVHQCPNSENQQLLDLYLVDYMRKKGMHQAAEIFQAEARVRNDPIKIDEPNGILKLWWAASIDAYVSSKMKNNQETT